MNKIVVDMQNFLFGDSVAAAFKNSDYDIDVVRARSPRKIQSNFAKCISRFFL